MLSYILPAIVLALSSVLPAQAESSFLQPPAAGPSANYRNNPRYALGERIEIQWMSDLELMHIMLWQEYPRCECNGRALAGETASWILLWRMGLSMLTGAPNRKYKGN